MTGKRIKQEPCPWQPLIDYIETDIRVRHDGIARRVAYGANIAEATLSGLLNCEHRPLDETLEKLARYYNLGINQVRALAGRGATLAEEVNLEDPELDLMFRAIKYKLSPAARESVIRYLRYVIRQDQDAEAQATD